MLQLRSVGCRNFSNRVVNDDMEIEAFAGLTLNFLILFFLYKTLKFWNYFYYAYLCVREYA